MKSYALFGLGSVALSIWMPVSGCSYEAPHAEQTSGSGGMTDSSSSGQGGSAGQTGSGGQSGSGGQGGGGTCTPGVISPCNAYPGPLGTEKVGTCIASQKTCSAAGMWGACDKAILPIPEGCTGSNADSNCDTLTPCSGTFYKWYSDTNTGYTADDTILAMATHHGQNGNDGPVYAVGFRDGAVDAQGQVNGSHVLVWARDATGQIQDWSDRFTFTSPGGINGAIATGVATLSSGDIIVVGTFVGGKFTVQGFPTQQSAVNNTFMVRLTPTGSVVKANFITSASAVTAVSVATDPSDNIYIGGNYIGVPVVDNKPLTAAADNDAFLVSLSPDFGWRWAQTINSAGPQSIVGITATPTGDIIAAASFTGQILINSNGTMQTLDAGGDADLLLSRLEPAMGKAAWHTQIMSGNSGRLQLGGLTANASAVAFGARFTGSVTVPGQTYTNMDGGGTTDAVVATLSLADGTVMHKFASQSSGMQDVRDLSFDSFGDLVLTGAFSESFPAQQLVILGTSEINAFVMKIDANLNGRWGQRFGDPAIQTGQAVVVGKSTGRINVGGGFQGTLTGVEPAATSRGGFDPFLIELGD